MPPSHSTVIESEWGRIKGHPGDACRIDRLRWSTSDSPGLQTKVYRRPETTMQNVRRQLMFNIVRYPNLHMDVWGIGWAVS